MGGCMGDVDTAKFDADAVLAEPLRAFASVR